jgi:hypothetical protein
MTEHPKTSNKVAIILKIDASNSNFAERKILNKARKPSQGESRDNLLSK